VPGPHQSLHTSRTRPIELPTHQRKHVAVLATACSSRPRAPGTGRSSRSIRSQLPATATATASAARSPTPAMPWSWRTFWEPTCMPTGRCRPTPNSPGPSRCWPASSRTPSGTASQGANQVRSLLRENNPAALHAFQSKDGGPDQAGRPHRSRSGTDPGKGSPAHPGPAESRPQAQWPHPCLRHRSRALARHLPLLVRPSTPGRKPPDERRLPVGLRSLPGLTRSQCALPATVRARRLARHCPAPPVQPLPRTTSPLPSDPTAFRPGGSSTNGSPSLHPSQPLCDLGVGSLARFCQCSRLDSPRD
jgi:hypothetical protein